MKTNHFVIVFIAGLLLVWLYLSLLAPFGYEGEGRFMEYGWGRQKYRSYDLELNKVYLDKNGTYTSRIESLPPAPFTFGLMVNTNEEIRSCSATVQLKATSLTSNRVLFDYQRNLKDLHFQEPGSGYFRYFAFADPSVRLEVHSEVPIEYSVEIASESCAIQHEAYLYMVGGGWK